MLAGLLKTHEAKGGGPVLTGGAVQAAMGAQYTAKLHQGDAEHGWGEM